MSHLILLHGALGVGAQFASLLPVLHDRFTVHTLDFEGHGTTPARGRPFRIEHFVDNVVDYMGAASIESAHVFGYSMGGYVALALARHRPALVSSVVTLATKVRWTSDFAAREVKMLDSATIRTKVPKFADILAARHSAMGWESVLGATAEMMRTLGETPLLDTANFAAIQQPTRICVGDRDATVSIDESVEVARTLPNASLEVFPNTPHPWEKVDVMRVIRALDEVTSTTGVFTP